MAHQAEQDRVTNLPSMAQWVARSVPADSILKPAARKNGLQRVRAHWPRPCELQHKKVAVLDLCCGIASLASTLIEVGYTISDVRCVDNDPTARLVAQHHLQSTAGMYPRQLSSAVVISDSLFSLPQDVLKIGMEHLVADGQSWLYADTLFIGCGWPCQHRSAAGRQDGADHPFAELPDAIGKLIDTIDRTIQADINPRSPSVLFADSLQLSHLLSLVDNLPSDFVFITSPWWIWNDVAIPLMLRCGAAAVITHVTATYETNAPEPRARFFNAFGDLCHTEYMVRPGAVGRPCSWLCIFRSVADKHRLMRVTPAGSTRHWDTFLSSP